MITRSQSWKPFLLIGFLVLLWYPFSTPVAFHLHESLINHPETHFFSYNGEADWINRTAAPSPPRRNHSPLVYDNESDRVILFSGWVENPTTNRFHNDTWAYDSNTNTWINRTPLTMPPGRGGHLLAYDGESDRVILFGGAKSGGGSTLVTRQDTWVYDWNTNTWTNMSPSVMPSGRLEASIAYDTESDLLILFAGYTDGGIYSDETWTYDYNTNTWTNMNPTTHPSPRQSAPMAYDVESDKCIIMGGWHNLDFLKETWAYDVNSNTWTQMNPTPHPEATSYGLSYDVESDCIIAFGGAKVRSNDWDLTSDTWAYDFNTDTWTNMNSWSYPSARARAYMTYDEESDLTILHGGKTTGDWSSTTVFNDTWVYDYQFNPPSPPLNLTAVHGPYYINLTWEYPSTDTGSPVTQYQVYRGNTSGSHQILAFPGLNHTYTDIHVIPGITYYYVVTAQNAMGQGLPSNEASATIPPPRAPIDSLLVVVIAVFSVIIIVSIVSVLLYLRRSKRH